MKFRPGQNYEIQYCATLGSGWPTLPNSQRNAGPGQLTLSLTDLTVGTDSARFYRVHLINP